MEQNQQEQSEENKNDPTSPSEPKKETSHAQTESTESKQDDRAEVPQNVVDSIFKNENKKGRWSITHTLALLSLSALIGLGVNTCYQNHQQYLATNKPRLQMIYVHFDEASLKNQPVIFFQLENQGGYPMEVLHAEWGWTIGDATDPRPWEKYQGKMINTIMPFAVSKERPFNQKITLIDFDTTTVFIMRHLLNPFYLFGNFFYHDQIADIDMVYKVIVQVRLDGSFTYVINENEPAP